MIGRKAVLPKHLLFRFFLLFILCPSTHLARHLTIDTGHMGYFEKYMNEMAHRDAVA
jgi:hypothetical protein